MSGAPDHSKLRWRCRRGTKELDTLTCRYLDNHYSDADLNEQRAFAHLLEMQDPELHSILTREQQVSDPLIISIVKKIHSM